MAVSKTHGPERIRALLECGQRDFGENRPNEAEPKFALVGAGQLPEAVRPICHHIGPLQTGSARQVARTFHWVQGVGSLSALRALDAATGKQARLDPEREPIRYLIQLHLTAEDTKLGGVSESGLEALLSARPQNPWLAWVGFMTMGPESGDAQAIRNVFARLRVLRDRHIPGGELSMGMSGDWEIAVDEGATIIRVGTLLFGPRAGAPWKPSRE